MQAIVKLKELGFDFRLEGDRILPVWIGPGEPPKQAALPLFLEIKKHRVKAITFLSPCQFPKHRERDWLTEWGRLKYADWQDKTGKPRCGLCEPEDKSLPPPEIDWRLWIYEIKRVFPGSSLVETKPQVSPGRTISGANDLDIVHQI